MYRRPPFRNVSPFMVNKHFSYDKNDDIHRGFVTPLLIHFYRHESNQIGNNVPLFTIDWLRLVWYFKLITKCTKCTYTEPFRLPGPLRPNNLQVLFLSLLALFLQSYTLPATPRMIMTRCGVIHEFYQQELKWWHRDPFLVTWPI